MNCHSCDELIKPRKIPLDVAKLRLFSKNCKDCVKTCMEHKKKGKIPLKCRDYVTNNKMLIKILEKIADQPVKVKKNIKSTFPKALETKDVLFRPNKRTFNPRSITPPITRPTGSPTGRPVERPLTVVPRAIPSRYQGPRGPRGLGPRGNSGLNTSRPATQRPRRPPTTQIVQPGYETLGFNTSRPTTNGPRGVHPDYEALGFNTSRPTTHGFPGAGPEALGFHPTTHGPRNLARPDYEALGYNSIRPTTTQGPRNLARPDYEALGYNSIRPTTTQVPRNLARPDYEALGFNTIRPTTTRGATPPGFEEIMRRLRA